MTEPTTELALQDATTRDLIRALGVREHGWPATLLVRPATWLTRPLVREAAAFDRSVREQGLAVASERFTARLGATLEPHHEAEIPADGPLLIVANHPGLSDTLALFATIRRDDLAIIAEANPFLQALGSIRDRLIFLPTEASRKGLPIRPALRHLKQGGALLTFPRGRIEPEPAIDPDTAVVSLQLWSESVAMLARAVPEIRVLPVMVSGVLHPSAQRHWITRIRRTREGREQVGAYLQLLLKRFRNVRVQVRTGDVLLPGDDISLRVRAEMTRMLRASAGELSEQVEVVDVEQEVSFRDLPSPDFQPQR